MTKHIFIEHFMVKLYVCMFEKFSFAPCVYYPHPPSQQCNQCNVTLLPPSYYSSFTYVSYRITCGDKVQVTSTEVGENI